MDADLLIRAIGVAEFICYIYDLSSLYKLDWLNEIKISKGCLIINIRAGFDETSALLKDKFDDAEMKVFDFFDPAMHTELSIKRARKAYPPFPDTIPVTSLALPLANDSADISLVIFSAHEIRNEEELIAFSMN